MTTTEQVTEVQHNERWRSWSALLAEAIKTPGLLHRAYRLFPGYSMRNQLLALAQCEEREQLPGPLGTFVFWQRLGRTVRRGERALTLCVPMIKKREPTTEDATKEEIIRWFTYRRGWFTVHQTNGPDVTLPATPEWDATRAMSTLGVQVTPFADVNGNKQGYALPGKISINPVAALAHKTLMHELAHLVLNHHEQPDISRSAREVEAESVALLILNTLELPGAEYSRGYLQQWLGNNNLTETMAQRICNATDKILNAGRRTTEGSVGSGISPGPG